MKQGEGYKSSGRRIDVVEMNDVIGRLRSSCEILMGDSRILNYTL
jgi:hypothetical protein